MNLLAHAFLSSSGTECRLGNLLADFVKGPDRKAMPPEFLAGVRQHQAVDAFTDLHPIFCRSKARIRGYPYVRGILVDVFYDHLLSRQWTTYSAQPLNQFTEASYADLQGHRVELPAGAKSMLERIVANDLLGSYQTIDGVRRTLERLGAYLRQRFEREFYLAEAVATLEANFDGLDRDFAEFFPLLCRQVSDASSRRKVG